MLRFTGRIGLVDNWMFSEDCPWDSELWGVSLGESLASLSGESFGRVLNACFHGSSCSVGIVNADVPSWRDD